MYQRGMNWETYLEFDGFKDDIIHGLERQTSEAAVAQAQTTHVLNAGFGEMIADQQEMNAVMQSGFAAVSYGLKRVSNGIESLRADFDWAMGAVLWKMELQHTTLRNILTTLQAPLDTQAKELRSRAEEAYVNGWYDEALTDLLESEQKNYQDFAVHQTIGNIYLYHRQPADLDKARAYYLKAGKYATPRSASHAAQAFMHAAFVCYLQRDDKAAIENARRATELAPQLVEAFFNHAKFAAAAGQAAVAIPSLERTIRTDRNYAIKAHADADFENIEAAVTDLMERLRSEARQQTQTQWQALQTEIDRYVIAPQEHAPIERTQAEVVALMKQDTYFGYLDAPAKILVCRKVFESLRLPERDQLRAQITGALARLRAEMTEYVVPGFFRTRLNRELAEVERLLTQLTFASVSAARDKMVACEEQGQAVMAGNVVREVLDGHTEEVYNIAFSPDGTTLASTSPDTTVRLWDVTTGSARVVLGHIGNSIRIAFSPDGATLASSSNDPTERFGQDGAIRVSAGSDGNKIYLWDVATGYQRAVLKGHTRQVYCVAFSPDGLTLASGSADHIVRLWDVATGRERAMLKGLGDPVFSPDGTMLATYYPDDPTARVSDYSDGEKIYLWDVATGRERAVLKGHTKYVSAYAFSPGGATLASSSHDTTVRLWDVATGRERAVLRGHTEPVSHIAFSPDGATLASVVDYGPPRTDTTVRLWDVATGRERAVLRGHTMPVGHIAFSSDGATLASRSRNEVWLWDVTTGRERAVLKGLDNMTFSPDGATLASSNDNKVRLWDVATGRERAVLDGHTGRVHYITFSLDGVTLASSSADHTVRLWGQAIHKAELERRDRQRQEEKRKREEEEHKQQQQWAWRAAGCCEICGEKLGFLDKAKGNARCKQHR